MKFLNLNNLKKDNYNGIEFASSPDINGWFITFSRIDSISYSGHLGLDYELEDLNGNIVILKNDNYVIDLELMIQENNENLIVSFRSIEDEKYNLIARLDSNLEVLEFGQWGENIINLQQQSFSTIEGLIKKIDEYFFYDFFETY